MCSHVCLHSCVFVRTCCVCTCVCTCVCVSLFVRRGRCSSRQAEGPPPGPSGPRMAISQDNRKWRWVHMTTVPTPSHPSREPGCVICQPLWQGSAERSDFTEAWEASGGLMGASPDGCYLHPGVRRLEEPGGPSLPAQPQAEAALSLPPSVPGVGPPELTSSLAPSGLWACSHVQKDPRRPLDGEVGQLTSPAVLRG